jgi:hypothetical protein
VLTAINYLCEGKAQFMNIVRISRHFNLFLIPIAASIVSFPIAASAVTIAVPGSANPYLAGLPNGSTASGGDSAPGQSPVLVTGVPITFGTSLNFSATGATNNSFSLPASGSTPDGGTVFSRGSENGISGTTTRLNSLVGVFLDSSTPTASLAPSALDFGTVSSQSYLSLSPLLKQVFFIGDGLTGTGSGSAQTVVVPFGATRLFLGSADGFEWNNNSGQFTVNVSAISASTAVPEPFTVIGTLIGGTVALRMRKKLKSTTKI